MDDNPDEGSPPAAETGRFSWKSALMGGAIGIGGPAFSGTLIFNLAMIIYQRQGKPMKDFYAQYGQLTFSIPNILGLISTISFALLCGWMAASFRPGRPVWQGLAAGLLSILFPFVAMLNTDLRSIQLWMWIMSFAFPIFFSVVGAYLYVFSSNRQRSRTVIATPPKPPAPEKIVGRRGRLAELRATIATGLRASLFLRTSPDQQVEWSHLILFVALSVLVQFLGDYAQVGAKGNFSLYGLPGNLFILPILIYAASYAASRARQTEKTLQLLVIFSFLNLMKVTAGIVCGLAMAYLTGEHARYSATTVLVEHVMTMWLASVCAIYAWRCSAVSLQRKILILLCTAILIVLPVNFIYVSKVLWFPEYNPATDDEANLARSPFDAETIFYLQSKLLDAELSAVQPGNHPGINLYFIGMAGYADQDVFMKEIHSVSELFKKRFGTAGHSIMLINNSKTVKESPIASMTSLGLSLNRVGAMMDRDKDILFLYLTSHGSRDHVFSLEFGDMKFNDLNPKRLRELLDASGIKNRIVVISACYSGGFIDALKNDDTLVITSAAADRTSFGCGNDEEFTYFGKAYFADSLPNTDSFITAFDKAVPLIEAREAADAVTPSSPRIFVGRGIKDKVDEFSHQNAMTRDGDRVPGQAGKKATLTGTSIK